MRPKTRVTGSWQVTEQLISSHRALVSLAIANLNVQLIEIDGTTVLGTAAAEPAGSAETLTSVSLPSAGDYFVRVFEGNSPTRSQLYSLTITEGACLDDDAQGQALQTIWELELDTEILDEEAWKSIGQRGFDAPRYFGAYMHALRWNCVTATNPRLFQAPFRAGIRIDA